jgi:predicted nuclease of restriction endonuclease-like (RecB) superfamily
MKLHHTNMERETKTIQADGYKFELKCWLTANEQRAIENATFNGLKLTQEQLQETIAGELLAKMTQNTENATIQAYVLSFNDSKENILNNILESKASVLKNILLEIGNLTSDEEKEKKN